MTALTVSPRIVLIVRTVLYGIIVICSFVIFGSLGVSMSKHDSNCLLYAEIGNPYAAKSTCDYSIAVAVLFCLVCPLIIIVVTVLTFLGVLKDQLTAFKDLPFLINVIGDGVALFLVLVSACIISVGFKTLCDSLVGDKDISCSLTAVKAPHDESNLDFFYDNLAAAEGGAWTAFVMYLILLVIGLMVLWKHGRLPCLPWQPKAEAQTPSSPEDPRF